MDEINNINAICINARSIRGQKLEEIELLLDKLGNDIHIIFISETWIYSHEIMNYNLPSYNAVFNCRDHKQGGGTAIYVRNGLDFNLLLTENNYNTILIELINNETKIKLLTAYKSPSDNTNEFIKHLDYIFTKYDKILYAGDTNINLLDDNTTVASYKNMLESNGICICNQITVDNATRVTSTTATVLDHVLSTKDIISELNLIDAAVSDHKIIFMKIKEKIMISEAKSYKTVKIVNYKECGLEISRKLKGNQCLCIKELITIVQNAKNIHTSEKKIKTKNVTWFNYEIKKLIETRNYFYRKMKKFALNEYYIKNYKKFRNKVVAAIKSAKQNNFNKQIEYAENNPRKVWQVLNGHLHNININDHRNSNITKIIDNNNEQITDSIMIADKLNKYFNEIGIELERDIQYSESFTVKNEEASNSIFIKPATIQEVKMIINNLKRNSSSGPDGISIKDLKMLINVITPIITQLINRSLQTATFPDCLKESVIIPIHKSGIKTELNNYRPISLINNIGKIYEKVIYHRIMDFVNKNSGLDPCQYGFQKKCGTDSAVSEAMRYITDSLDSNKYVAAVYVDLRKAFDTVNHKLLLERLNEIGLRGQALVLIESYLSRRLVSTRVNGHTSSPLTLRIGVPQGSVLGPLLYLLYINNLQYTNLLAKRCVFADDTCLLYSSNHREELEVKVNKDVKIYCNWLKGNKLTINADKTKYMIFRNKNKKNVQIEVKVNGKVIDEVDKYNYLGMIVDNKLKWTYHVDKITKKMASVIGAVRRVNVDMRRNTANLIYHAHIISHVRYNLICWSHCSNNLKNRVVRLINKAIKILFKFDYFTPTNLLYKLAEKMTLKSLIMLEKVKYVHRIIKGDYKCSIVISRRNDIHNYETRSRCLVQPIRSRTENHRTSLLSSAILIYNNLPGEIVNEPTWHIFIKKLKKHIMMMQ